MYLPEPVATGITIRVTSGVATLYGGAPDAVSHRGLVTLTVGDSFVVSGLAPGEVLSVQAGSSFSYEIVPAAAPEPPISGPGEPEAPEPEPTVSAWVTWSCTGSPCPWGPSLGGQALVWPSGWQPELARLGYTTSHGIYLPDTAANGVKVTVSSGTATLYAGAPSGASHRALVTLSVGDSHVVSGLLPGEVLSVQGAGAFGYEIDVVDIEPEVPPAPPLPQEPTPGPSDMEPSATDSEWVTWSCTGTPCPWGNSVGGQALAWPLAWSPAADRLGYTVSRAIYLPAGKANGTTIAIASGIATLYAGAPGSASHRALVTLSVGDTYTVSGLLPGEVLSVQGVSIFSYAISGSEPVSSPPVNSPPAVDGDVIESVPAWWRCNTPGCTDSDWHAAVINWPAWAAYSTNNREGQNSRTVYSAAGDVLYPYMGSWAHGCEVTVVSGTVLIIEWERGTDVWRETWLAPGETHVINLVAPENGAMIETYDWGTSFSVILNDCSPQPLP